MSGAVKGLVSLVVVVVMLYFVITSIQNLMQARSDVDLAQKQVDYWKGQTVIEKR